MAASATFPDLCTACSSLTRSSPLTAARSSTATGALRWLSPTTRMLIWPLPRLPDPPRSPVGLPRSCLYSLYVLARAGRPILRGQGTETVGSPGLALLVEREDLEFDRQVDLAHVDALRDRQDDGREVQHARAARGHDAIAHPLGGARGGRDHGDGHAVVRDDLLQPVDVLHRHPGDLLADDGLVRVEQSRDPEAAGRETAVAGQCPAKVTDADDRDHPVLGEPQFAGDLVDEVLDLVPHAARPIRAEVGQVLAELRRVDAGRRG